MAGLGLKGIVAKWLEKKPPNRQLLFTWAALSPGPPCSVFEAMIPREAYVPFIVGLGLGSS